MRIGSQEVKRGGCCSFNNVTNKKLDLQEPGEQNVIGEHVVFLVTVTYTNYEPAGISQKFFVGQLCSEMLHSVWRSEVHWQLTCDGLS